MITKPEGPATYEWAMTQAEELASTLRAVLGDPEGRVACRLAMTQFYDPASVPPPSTLDYAMRAIRKDLRDLLLPAMESGEFSPGERTGFVRYLLRFWTRDDLESAIMMGHMKRAFDPVGYREPAWEPDWEAAGAQSRHGKQSSHGRAGLRQAWHGLAGRSKARRGSTARAWHGGGLAWRGTLRSPQPGPPGEGPASGPGLAEDYVAGGRLGAAWRARTAEEIAADVPFPGLGAGDRTG